MGRKGGFAQFGQPEYQRRWKVLGYSPRGFKTMVVSNISTGAGSVELSNLPDLPSTDCTSGNVMMIPSVLTRTSLACSTAIIGSPVGMYMSEPSRSCGMNSEPSESASGTTAGTSRKLTRSVVLGKRRAQLRTGA